MTRSEGTSKQLLLSLLVPYLYLLSEIHSLELSLISLPLRSDHELLNGMSICSNGASRWRLGDSLAVVHKASISGSNTLVCYVEGVDLVLLGEPQVEAYVVVLEDCTPPQSSGADPPWQSEAGYDYISVVTFSCSSVHAAILTGDAISPVFHST